MSKRLQFNIALMVLGQVLRVAARRSPAFRRDLSRRRCIAQLRLKDRSAGRHFVLDHGRILPRAGLHPAPDVDMVFRDLDTALTFMRPNPDYAQIVHAAKHFKVQVIGRDERVVWFMQLLNHSQRATLELGTRCEDGSIRYTTNSNGGPLFVYVRDGRILRTTPIEFTDADAASWTVRARGREFKPWRKTTAAPHALAFKSLVHSDKRLLYPMKRVDFDPDGARNPHNRGISGYERISWDAATAMVASEIQRQKRVHGPGAMALFGSSHHQWGNVGYYLSAMLRFGNLVGFTRVHPNPDSWEGWYWGGQHHFGSSLRVGIPGQYGTLEDCLQESEMIVFWSSDPESTNGAYQGFEGTQRRLWAKQLGIEFVHIDPHFNPTAQLLGGKWLPIRPGTDPALAQAIMYVWVVEDLYDKDYVARCTTGFEEWRDYLLGKTDGVPKTPQWQECETGIAARDVRALARLWGKRKTYLSAGAAGAGFGGACRSATGTQWARCMIQLMAMRGWGKPGINFGNLQSATPVDLYFYFPGYADGGISGELSWTASAVSNYQRMPHILTQNPVKQLVPRQRFPEAILTGRATGYLWDGTSLEAQFSPYTYPMPGYSPIHMLYRYGGSTFGTVARSGRFIEAYRHESLECVVNQSIWFEGEAQFADIILPACTSLERHDISEWSNAGGYAHHAQYGLNHRVILMQHKCIEPLGESKSDYQIFLDILTRLGLGAVFSEGCSELDWCKRVFDSSDLPKVMTWKEFLRKGYYVVPAEADSTREPVYFRWFAEGRHKDVPEPHPLPSQYAGEYGIGLQTPSGKLEFVPETLRRFDPHSEERPPLNRYIPSWEGPHSVDLVAKYPLQMVSTHSRYSFHTYADGKNSAINDIEDHRERVDGYYYLLIRINSQDAASRSIADRSLVKVFNARGAVICAADVSPLIAPGVVKAFESSAEFLQLQVDGEWVECGGCVNMLTPDRPQVKGTDGMGSNSCLVQIAPWHAREALARERGRAEARAAPAAEPGSERRTAAVNQ